MPFELSLIVFEARRFNTQKKYNAMRDGGRGRGGRGRGGRGGRGRGGRRNFQKPPTHEELDAELEQYTDLDDELDKYMKQGEEKTTTEEKNEATVEEKE